MRKPKLGKGSNVTKVTPVRAQGRPPRTALHLQFHETHKVNVPPEKSRVERDQLRKPYLFHTLKFKPWAALRQRSP